MLAAVLVAPASAQADDQEPGSVPEGDFAAQSLTSSAVAPGLQVIVHERGMVSQSIDAAGSTSGTSQLGLVKPSGATLRRAVLVAASTGYRGPIVGSVHLDGRAVEFENSTSSDIGSVNYWQDVTDRVQAKVDAAPAGLITFAVAEDNPLSVDGVILALIFDDPSQTAERSATLLFGATQPAGDAFTLNMTGPLDPSGPDSILEMSLGISYGYQQGGARQYSIVDVNGQRLTTSAGGEDDGEPANGALITVGGTGDLSTNPSPTALPSSARTDDERYDLRPFVQAGDTSIRVEMSNPSRDDNILFAAFTTNPPVDAFFANQDVLVRVRHNRTERFFDNAYSPGATEQVEVLVAPDIDVAEVELRADGLSLGTQTAGSPYVFDWRPSSTVSARTLQARVTDAEGTEHIETLTAYALISAEGAAVSYLPDNPQELRDADLVKWNAFSADPFTPAAAPATVVGYGGKYRSHNGLDVFAKSDGNRFFGHLTDVDRHVGDTYYCDDAAVPATILDSTTVKVTDDGTTLALDSRLESRVNAVAPDVWGPIKPPGGLIGPLGHSEAVPPIFSTMRAQVRTDGTSEVALAGDRATGNSWYPMHHVYDDGARVGGPAERPATDQVAWSRTVENSVAKVIAHVPGWAFDAPTFFMQALRAECARQRLERINPDAYDALHSTWNTLLGTDRVPLLLLPALKSRVWMHMFPVEWEEGRAGPDFTRSPDCKVPGCPGVSKWRWVTFRSPVTVHVYDEDGRHTGPNPDGTFDQELPDVLHLDDGVAGIVRVPDRPGYRVEVKGDDTGLLTVDTGHFDGADRTLFEQYYKLEVHDGSHGIFELGQDEEGLHYDVDGDGGYVHLMPETRTTSSAAQESDSAGPVTSVRVNGTELTDAAYPAPASVTLSASDDLAGVYVTDYSLDGGATWERYSAPIVLDVEGDHLIAVRSEDYNGNIEPVRTLTVRVGEGTTATATFDRPVEDPSTLTTVRHGRVLPVKVAISGGDEEANATVALDLRELSSCPGGEIGEPVTSEAAGNANSGNVMRFDAGSERWIYNLSTGHLREGACYRVEVRHGGMVEPSTGLASGGALIGSFVLYLRD